MAYGHISIRLYMRLAGVEAGAETRPVQDLTEARPLGRAEVRPVPRLDLSVPPWYGLSVTASGSALGLTSSPKTQLIGN